MKAERTLWRLFPIRNKLMRVSGRMERKREFEKYLVDD